MSQPYFAGITGGSASGKTYCLELIRQAFAEHELTLISQDNYYKDFEDQVPDEHGNVNFDHPDAVQLDLLRKHLTELGKGDEVSIREYTFNHPDKINKPPNIITYKPTPIILVEGLFVFYDKRIQRLLDLKIFIEVDEHIKLTRRIKRDISERGFDMQDVLDQYSEYVVPMYRKYVEPLKYDADILIMNNRHLDKGAEVVIDHLKGKLASQK